MALAYREGPHRVTVQQVGFQETSTKKPMIVIKVLVIDEIDRSMGEERLNPVPNSYERTIRLVVPDTEDNRKYILMKLRHAGWTGDRFEEVEQLIGHDCVAVCKHEVQTTPGKYEGQTTEQWDLELPKKPSTPIESVPTMARKLNALFGKSLKEGSAKPSKDEPKTKADIASDFCQPAGVTDMPDDEVPF